MTDWAILLFLGIPACAGWALAIAGTIQWWRDRRLERRRMAQTDAWLRGYNAMLVAKAAARAHRGGGGSKGTVTLVMPPKDAA